MSQLSRAMPLLWALALLAGLLAGCGDGTSVTGNGYAFEVADGWDAQTDEDSNAGDTAGGQASIDTFVYGPESDGFVANVNIVRQPGIPDRITVERYVDLGLARVRQDPESFGLPADVEVEVVEAAAAGPEIDHAPSSQVTYGLDDGSLPLRLRQTVAFRDGVAYTITYSALESSFEGDLGGLERILESWRWR